MVRLEPSCRIDPAVYGDELLLELGSRDGSLSLAITEEMVDRLSVVFAEAQARFRELDDAEWC
jgi:hypothetical protein